ncbi:MAG: BamA/TamA family outer membrane protein, partial [Candidatus Omnitrophica bacterium]|nr:BamA/TamA family outer membrane protein [Candidatus Omnitrophota bacterium]
ELRIKPGERYDGTKIRRSKERLYNLGYFEEVAFDTEAASEPTKRDLAISVKEAKTGEFSFGAGFSSVDKLLGFVQVAQNNFDIANPPTFTGDGQKLALRANVGTVRRDYEVSFTEPWIFDHPVLFGFDLYNRTTLRESDIGFGFDEERRGGALRLGKEFREYLRGDLTYRLERIAISDVSASATDDLKRESGRNSISSLASQLTLDTRDNIFAPSRGYTVSGSLETAGGLLGADKDFIKAISSGALYLSTWQNWVLEFHLRGGWASEFGDSKDVPIYERFFAGGANTIRGYRERRIGPKDSNTDDPIGGKSMMIANVEYVFPIVEVLKGSIFYDTGNVWRRAGDIGSGTFRSGTGVGMRIKTPIGPVKLDWGYPLNPPAGESKKGRFHFNISRGF